MGINPKLMFALVAMILSFALGCHSGPRYSYPPPEPCADPSPFATRSHFEYPNGQYCTSCQVYSPQASQYCGRCGSKFEVIAAPDPASTPSTLAARPPQLPPDQVGYFRLAPNELKVVEQIASEGIWFDETWGDLYLQNDWRDQVTAVGGRLEPAGAAYWCPELMVVRGPNSNIIKKWEDVRGTKTMQREGGVSAQIDKLRRTMNSSGLGLVRSNGEELAEHPQVLFAKNRAEHCTFEAPANSPLTANGKFSKILYQASY